MTLLTLWVRSKGGTSGSVHKEYIEKNLEELQVPKLKWKGIREGLVRRLLEEQDKVFKTHAAHTHRGSREANTDIQIHEHTHTIHKHICRPVEIEEEEDYMNAGREGGK